jgi:hypothetical protein
LFFLVVSYSSFPIVILHAFVFSYMLYALPISSSVTWSFLLHFVKSSIYEVPRYSVFSNVHVYYIIKLTTQSLHLFLAAAAAVASSSSSSTTTTTTTTTKT